MSRYVKVAKRSEIPEGVAICVEVEGRRVALFNLDGDLYAIDDTCTHRGGPLSEGAIMGDEVECPWHGARFNIKSGAPVCPPAARGVKKYDVRLAGDAVEIEV